ncbi:unnamed protein product [Rotaria socialis]|uniref:F-box domain-containing protein n=2 Tax=Rotaria socialis TaxID=392032 RepID=A0A817Y848_9BILA|nr:unnamed protein product [Rotaria socialis]
MNTLNNNDFNILDLPDEILLVILNKLNTTDVFHSLVDVNQQFDRLAFDYLYVRNIDMTDTMIINSLYDQISSIDTKILSKICEKVLPRIHHQVYKLTIEQYSMQHIILAANYPQHYSLSLINFQEEILYQYLTSILFYFLCFLLIKDDLIRRDLLTKQITHLKARISEYSSKMLWSTRDAQRERQATQHFVAATTVGRFNVAAFDNVSFHSDSIPDCHVSDILSRRQSLLEVHPQQVSTVVDIIPEEPTTNDAQPSAVPEKRRYSWRMTYYFYIHVSFFIISGLVCGLIVWLIENHSSSRNLQMDVAYIDAWFVSSSCVYSCGLTSLDFAKLSHASQIVLMLFTFISGVTISTLPALVVKTQTHRNVEGITVDDDHGVLEDGANNELRTFNIQREPNFPEHMRQRLKALPTAAQLRFRAYITCIILILSTCFAIYSIGFIAIGSWLQACYTPEQLLQGNSTVNPWYISFIFTITGFNQNGLSPFSDGLSRFVYDVYLNLFVMMVVMSGTSFFPFILRNVVLLARRLSPWHHKVIFDYILMNNHRLSTLLFPSVQTRIYLLVTMLLYILGVSISLILDLKSAAFAVYSPGTRVLIFFFQTVNTRFAGFQTIDLNLLASGTLLVYLLLMATKPQMLCALDESPFELSWLALQAKEEANAETNSIVNGNSNLGLSLRNNKLESIQSLPPTGVLPVQHVKHFLRRQSYVTKNLAREEFTKKLQDDDNNYKSRRLQYLRGRLFLIYFVRSIIQHIVSFVILTRTWLFFFIFLICAIEYHKMAPIDPNITIFKVIFEIISAFGTVGLSLGYPNVASSFSTVLSPASKTIIVATMLMGRHRGLLASMKDQEVIEHSADDLLDRRREEVMNEYQRTQFYRNILLTIRQDEAITTF